MKNSSPSFRYQEHPCRSGIHLWTDPQKACRCCAGYLPVRVPVAFAFAPRDWAMQPIERLYDYTTWSRILIPTSETHLYQHLWVRQPTAYQSSTGPINPGLFTEN